MAATPRFSCRGYSLLELVLVMGLSAMIVGGMGLALQAQERAYRSQASGRQELQELDLAVRQLQRDLQLAGKGLPPGTLPAVATSSDDGRTVLSIRYLSDDPFITRLTQPATDQASLFRIPAKAAGHFQEGDQILIHNDGAWLAFLVGDVQSRSSPGLRPASDILSSADGEPFRLTFPQGSEVVRLRNAEVQYVFPKGKIWTGRLVRRRGGQKAVIATGVQDFNVEYLVVSANETSPRWTSSPTQDKLVLGNRVRLAVGQTMVRFMVTRRNAIVGYPS